MLQGHKSPEVSTCVLSKERTSRITGFFYQDLQTLFVLTVFLASEGFAKVSMKCFNLYGFNF